MISTKMQSGATGGRGFIKGDRPIATCPRRAWECHGVSAILLLLFLARSIALAADRNTPPKTAQAWTREEATAQLWLNPEDVYLQYVALQLARNEGKAEEAKSLIDQLTRQRWGFFGQSRERDVDLFSLFSGALAVQESLQLDAMRNPDNPKLGKMADPTRNRVKIGSLAGPSVESHPWDKMLAAQMVSGNRPEIGPLDV